MRVCYSKMHGCNDIPLVRTIFSRDERSRYKRASLYICCSTWRAIYQRFLFLIFFSTLLCSKAAFLFLIRGVEPLPTTSITSEMFFALSPVLPRATPAAT